MTLVGLLIFLLIAGFLVWVAMHLPVPFNWVVIGVVVIILLVLLLNSVNAGGVRLR